MSIWCFAIILLGNFCASFPSNNSDGFGYELLNAKMEDFEFRILEKLNELKDLVENQHSCHKSDINLSSQELQNATNYQSPTLINSCEEEQTKKSGRYMLSMVNSTPFEVVCEQQLHSGGWIVIQNRFDGSVDFHRNWVDYRNGFGNLSGEFWLGLERVHTLTAINPRMLLVMLENHEGVSKYAVYNDFAIGSESGKYKLKSLTRQYGTLDDSLHQHIGSEFATRDVEAGKCVKRFSGAWWNSNSCYYSNLNGQFISYKTSDTKSMNWYNFSNDHESLKISRMMIK